MWCFFPGYSLLLYNLLSFISLFQVQGFFPIVVVFVLILVCFLQRNDLDHPFIYYIDDKIKSVVNGSIYICILYLYIFVFYSEI